MITRYSSEHPDCPIESFKIQSNTEALYSGITNKANSTVTSFRHYQRKKRPKWFGLPINTQKTGNSVRCWPEPMFWKYLDISIKDQGKQSTLLGFNDCCRKLQDETISSSVKFSLSLALWRLSVFERNYASPPCYGEVIKFWQAGVCKFLIELFT